MTTTSASKKTTSKTTKTTKKNDKGFKTGDIVRDVLIMRWHKRMPSPIGGLKDVQVVIVREETIHLRPLCLVVVCPRGHYLSMFKNHSHVKLCSRYRLPSKGAPIYSSCKINVVVFACKLIRLSASCCHSQFARRNHPNTLSHGIYAKTHITRLISVASSSATPSPTNSKRKFARPLHPGSPPSASPVTISGSIHAQLSQYFFHRKAP